jgi:5-methylcytosine-specific restriction protein B
MDLTRESILKAIKRIDELPNLRKGRESIEYDLVFEGKKYPPILVLSEANKTLGGEELLLSDFQNSTYKAFKVLRNLGFEVDPKNSDISEQIDKFLKQSISGDLRTEGYLKSFQGFKVKIGFGQGNQARITWIAFLGEGQTVQNGIYPVYLFYKNRNRLILSYGISETNTPSLNWEIPNNKTIREYFKENNLGIPERYGDSYILKSYDTTKPLNSDEVNYDLQAIIDIYKEILTNRPMVESTNQIKFDLKSFKSSVSSANLVFDDKLLARYVASLLTKPFVILTGLSGSGKTKLAQAFAQWICHDENQYCILPIGADWTNREPILGYPNALKQGDYVKPDNRVLDVICEANKNPDLPYFVILDEMNLSHVERYFADFLSAMESGEAITLFPEGFSQNGVPANLRLPQNLFIVGTVNIDETTYMFSPKVLDRANTIEFRVSKEEIEQFFEISQDLVLPNLRAKGREMAKNFVVLSKNRQFTNGEIKLVAQTITSFFNHLKKAGAEFGFRTSSEIIRLINQLSIVDPTFSLNEKLDIGIMQKLLPKLHGSRRKLCPILLALGKLCVTDKISSIEKEVFDLEDFDFNVNAKVKYPISLEKIVRMYRGAVDNGYTSYAEA